MAGGALLRWWRSLWASGNRTPAAAVPPPTDSAPRRGGTGAIEAEAAPVATRRHYRAPPADDDPRREAHLGAVLQALARGPLSRAELGSRVGAADWGPGRLDAVVAHGVATGVLVETADGGVRARYAD
jgi:hypothetical protein